MTTRYGAMAATELPAVARILSLAFASPPDQAADWFRVAGLDEARVLRSDEGPLACLMRLPMGQHFGGRAVPMLGIAGVGVAPEGRGQGLALELMRAAVREAGAEGFGISCLYASTQSLYRQVGYEQAGHRFKYRLPLATIGVRDRSGPMVALTESDRAGVEACYRRWASTHQGALDRGAYVWGRVRELWGETYQGFGVPSPSGGLDGYIFITQRRNPKTRRQEIGISDMAFLTPAAGRRLLAFLADFGTVADEAVCFGGPHHLLMALMDQQRFAADFMEHWMLRVTSVKAALEGRGYPGVAEADLDLRVEDDLIPDNDGDWTLRIRDGAAEVRRGVSGGSGLRVDIRGLAAMYTGMSSPEQLRILGRASGDDLALLRARLVFAGPCPWMAEMF